MKLFLIGMMGTGKSHWTKKLSQKLKTGGYDLDFLIESHEEKTIAEIFAEEGEAYFRKSESKILRWFGEKKTFVLATGGGTPCHEKNMEWMNEQGITIWIDEPIDVLVERLKPGKMHRPLIKDLSDEALKEFLTGKLVERYPFYCRAKHHLQGDAISDAGFAQIIKQYA
ncbi:MAG: shikimate kinase [Bacteroidota bacterium]